MVSWFQRQGALSTYHWQVHEVERSVVAHAERAGPALAALAETGPVERSARRLLQRTDALVALAAAAAARALVVLQHAAPKTLSRKRAKQ